MQFSFFLVLASSGFPYCNQGYWYWYKQWDGSCWSSHHTIYCSGRAFLWFPKKKKGCNERVLMHVCACPSSGTSENISLPGSVCVFNMLFAGHSSILGFAHGNNRAELTGINSKHHGTKTHGKVAWLWDSRILQQHISLTAHGKLKQFDVRKTMYNQAILVYTKCYVSPF